MFTNLLNNEWRDPVEDPPEVSGKYLVFLPDSNESMTIYYSKKYNMWNVWDGCEDPAFREKVQMFPTGWMPALPAPSIKTDPESEIDWRKEE